MATELWRLPASALGRLLAQREVSAADLLDAALARVERLNPRLNAVVTLNDTARAEARASDGRHARGEALGALDGVPVTIKDNLFARGMRATWGSLLYADFVPEEDELPVGRLRGAGAVVLGKTNVPEFTIEGYTGNLLFGTTRNPWDLRLTPGGSSGGAVASVAAGLVSLAIGTDGGGSIRRPAAYAGLVGFKPSAGRVARVGGFPQLLHDFEVVGPMARSVEDAALAFRAMAGPDRRDRLSLLAQAPGDDGPLDEPPPRLRILYVPRFGEAPVDPTIRESCADAARVLAELGHAVEEGSFPADLEPIYSRWFVLSQVALARLVAGTPRAQELVAPKYLDLADRGAAIPATDYLDLLEAIEAFRQAVAAAFARWDVIATPACAAMPWPAEEAFPPLIDGQEAGPRGHAIFSGWVNACGHPGISLPARPSPEGLPIGLHLVGGFGRDWLLLRLARAYEQMRPWADRWPEFVAGS
jgi:aspartyl-tRNA(Asn)/glutamyl-tRNA(Gln) amidotransferase subunit A